MPFLPPELLNPTVFPKAFGRDLHAQVRMIRELWYQQMPILKYHKLIKATTAPTSPVSDPDTINQLSGEDGTTKWDPLYGESFDSDESEWSQPHLSTQTQGHEVQAGNVEQFHPPINMPMQIERVARENQLKRWGFDRYRTMVATIPLIIFDEMGIGISQGDEITWDDDERFVVLQWAREGYWQNTNVRLYAVLSLEHARDGA